MANSEETKPVEREGFDEWFDANYYTVDPIARKTNRATWDAALERAAALMRTRADDLGKQGYDEFHKAADAIVALKGSR